MSDRQLELMYVCSHLPNELWVSTVRYIILTDVSMKPVAEVAEPVIERQEDVCNESWHLWEHPALHFFVWYIDHFVSFPFPSILLHVFFFSQIWYTK